MPNVNVLDMTGKNVGTMELAESVFGIEPNTAVMHKMVVNYLANQRQGTQSALTRSEVSGGGKKPWRQKGTGHARQGSTRAPQWRHGGMVFAVKPRDYGFDVNKKERKLAMKSALSSKVASEDFIVLDNLSLEGYKTKVVAKMLEDLGVGDKKALIVTETADSKVYKSAANLPGVKAAPVNALCVYDMLNADKLIIVKQAVERLEEVYA
ncbi:MAG: 50S ribosomal protein L4 [Clostridiales bacterium]|nr:50S ribosomal protein L4 [Clostridiales bacterium]